MRFMASCEETIETRRKVVLGGLFLDSYRDPVTRPAAAALLRDGWTRLTARERQLFPDTFWDQLRAGVLEALGLPPASAGADETATLDDDTLDAMADARERGDMDAYYRLLRGRQLSPESLMALKNMPGMGAAFIRAKGLDTSRADARYGPGWLDRAGWD